MLYFAVTFAGVKVLLKLTLTTELIFCLAFKVLCLWAIHHYFFSNHQKISVTQITQHLIDTDPEASNARY